MKNAKDLVAVFDVKFNKRNKYTDKTMYFRRI